MKKILISPYSKVMLNGKQNPKNYPYWEELVKLLKEKDYYVTQLNPGYEPTINGIDEELKNLNLNQIKEELFKHDIWISVDNFFHHFAHYHQKYGYVIWGKSDPLIFGYPENINILKDRKCLRSNQFLFWFDEEYEEEVFLDALSVFNIISSSIK